MKTLGYTVPTEPASATSFRGLYSYPTLPAFSVGVVVDQLAVPLGLHSTCKAFINEEMNRLLTTAKSYQWKDFSAVTGPVLGGKPPLELLQKQPVVFASSLQARGETAVALGARIARAIRYLNISLGFAAKAAVSIAPPPAKPAFGGTLYVVKPGIQWFHNPVVMSLLTSVIRGMLNDPEEALQKKTRRLILEQKMGEFAERPFCLRDEIKDSKGPSILYDKLLSKKPGLFSFFGPNHTTIDIENWPNNHNTGIASWLHLICKNWTSPYKELQGHWESPDNVRKAVGL